MQSLTTVQCVTKAEMKLDNADDAHQLDQKSDNHFWRDTIKREMKKVKLELKE